MFLIVKEMIKPWLFGTQTNTQRLKALEKVIAESSNKLSAIETTLDKQQEKLQMLSHDVNSKTVSSDEVLTKSKTISL